MRMLGSKFLRSIAATAMALAIGMTADRATAEEGDHWAILSYQISFPEGDTHDFIDATSFRGIGIEGRWFVRPNLSAGVDLHWNVFFKSTNNTTNVPNGAVTGEQDRTLNVFPMLVTAHYYFGPNRMFYAGVGAGAYYLTQNLDIGLYTFSDTSWHFGFAPEIGISHEVGYHTRAVLALQYNYAFKAEDTTIDYWAIKIGVAY
jgi:Outer membrane protein beta-barrel domain